MAETQPMNARRLRRQRTATLVAWLQELNRFGWPKSIPDPESKDEADRPRRRAMMAEIESVLAWRVVGQHRRKAGH